MNSLVLSQAQEVIEDERVDLEAYKARLLAELRAKQDGGSEESIYYDDIQPEEAEYELSDSDYHEQPEYQEVQYEDEEEVVGSSFATTQSSAISFIEQSPTGASDLKNVFNGDVDVDDPHLAAVFPDFARSFAQDEDHAQELEVYDNLDFVDHSDFAVLNDAGQVEDYGQLDGLEEVIKASADNPETDGDSGGPTTLMLFNIFTPDEVDFLSTLVGEEALQELKDDVAAEPPVRPTVLTPHHFTDPKNALASSQATADLMQTSSIRESLKDLSGLEEEASFGSEEYKTHSGYDLQSANIRGNVEDQGRLESETAHAVEDRRHKMEQVLSKLTDKFEREEEAKGNKYQVSEEAKAKSNKMKDMIEKLKVKMAKSRSGVNRMDLTKVVEDPLEKQEEIKMFHTTPPPLKIEAIGEMIGQKIREMSMGIHRLDLDEVLDLDMINIDRASRDQPELPFTPKPPPKDPSPKMHPKLKSYRPADTGIVHLPSPNLKSFIKPVTDIPLNHATASQSPVSKRYIYNPSKYRTKPTPPPSLTTTMKYFTPPPAESLPSRDYPSFTAVPNHDLPPRLYYQDPPVEFDPSQSPTPEPKYLPSSTYREEKSKKSAKSLYKNTDAPSTKYPPPSNNYKQPNIRFESDNHGPSVIQVTPKNIPNPQVTTTTAATPVETRAPTTDPRSPKSVRVSSLSPRKLYIPKSTYASPYESSNSAVKQLPIHQVHYPNYLPKPEAKSSVSSLSLPARGVQTDYSQPTATSYYRSTTPGSKFVSTLSTVKPKINAYTPRYETPPPRTTSNPQVSKININFSPKSYYKTTTTSTGYLPPKQSYRPPSASNYANPTSMPKTGMVSSLVTSIRPPMTNYLPPKTTMKPPSKSHFSLQSPAKPQFESYMTRTTMKPPRDSYSPPKTTMLPPSNSYLPPKTTMRPPSVGYNSPKTTMEPPPQSYYVPNTTLQSPKLAQNRSYMPTTAQPSYHGTTTPVYYAQSPQPPRYLPPSGGSYYTAPTQTANNLAYSSQPGVPITHFLRPNPSYPLHAGYKPPQAGYEKPPPIYKPTQKPTYGPPKTPMYPPSNSYAPPRTNMKPPSNGYQPPPKKQILTPPQQGYHQPTYTTMAPPQQSYQQPVKPSYTSMVPPNQGYQQPVTPTYTSMAPPNQGYQQPVTPSYASMAPPNQNYQAPSYMTTMAPPHQGYQPPAYMTTMAPPTNNYAPPANSYLPPPQGGQMGIPGAVNGMMAGMNGMMAGMNGMMNGMNGMMNGQESEEDDSNESTSGDESSDTAGDDGGDTGGDGGDSGSSGPVAFIPPNLAYLVPELEYVPYEEVAAVSGQLHVHHNRPHYQHKHHEPKKKYYGYGHNKRILEDPKKPSEYNMDQVYSLLELDSKPSKLPTEYELPQKEYLPPKVTGILDHMHPPHKEYNEPERFEYASPKAIVKPPKVHYGSYLPPSKDYEGPTKITIDVDGKVHLQRNPQLEKVIVSPNAQFLKPPTKAYLRPHEAEEYQAPSLYYLPPNQDYQRTAVSISIDKDKVGMTAPETDYKAPKMPMQPPLGDYIAPKMPMKPPKDDYHAPNVPMKPPYQSYEEPEGEYMEPPGKSYYRPKGSHYEPPSKDYLPPKKKGPSYQPPSKEYLPPKQYHSTKKMPYSPPSKEYLPPKIKGARYKVPAKEYLPPKKSGTGNKYGYDLPSKEYLPPKKYVPTKVGMHGPEKDYSPPKYEKGYDLPSKEYLPPAKKYLKTKHMEPYKPPSKEYLPPKPKKDHPKLKYVGRKASMNAPEKDYSPPSYKTGLELPSKDYLPPKHTKGYDVPSMEYLQPETHSEKGHMIAPQIDYSPPAIKKTKQDNYNSALDKIKDILFEAIKPPSKDYLAPDNLRGVTYEPPSSEYLPHAVNHHDVKPTEITFELPSKEYLPPLSKKSRGETYKPPSKEYLPPAIKEEVLKHFPHLLPKVKMQPPHNDHPVTAAPHLVKIKPPSEEYLPPAEADLKLQMPHLLPSKTVPMKPPHQDYVPIKHTIHHPDLVPTKHTKFFPPNKEYLPPPHVSKGLTLKEIAKEFAKAVEHELPKAQHVKLGPDHHLKHFQVPQTNYIPPAFTHHEVAQQYEPLSPPSSNYLAPKPELHVVSTPMPIYHEPNTPTVHTTIKPVQIHHHPEVSEEQTLIDHPMVKVTASKQQDYKPPDHGPLVHYPPPHNINIQINLPEDKKKDEKKSEYAPPKPETLHVAEPVYRDEPQTHHKQIEKGVARIRPTSSCKTKVVAI